MKKFIVIYFGITIFSILSCSPKHSYPIQDGYITTQDATRLYYQKVGQGPEVVIIPSGMYLFDEFKCLMSKERTLLFYDQRSRGLSEAIKNVSKLGIKYELSDLESIRSHFGFQNISLIGWSYSGAVVALYAMEYPQHVKKVIQIGPIPPRKDPYWDEIIEVSASRRGESNHKALDDIHNIYQNSENTAKYIKEYYKVAHKGLFHGEVIENRFRSDFYNLINERPDNVWIIVLPAIIQSLGQWDFRDQLTKIDIPVLTIHGDYEAIPVKSAREWSDYLPQGKLVVISDAGHFPWLEKHDMVFKTIDKFLSNGFPKNTDNP
ncbi:hypothetical protein BVY01_03445 [bacterium I07]|nr:hypothetical protein BVY01_03445 [bacterium I07]